MTIIHEVNFRELDHHNAISELIRSCNDDEIKSEMKDTARTYRELRRSLLLSLNQMKQIRNDFGCEDDTLLISLREIIKSVREEEICGHEMFLSQSEFYKNEGA